ncbi:MAG: hypothetical protein RMK97_03540 [Sutterellaceae bacterium]|nr:hypothetical protein [Burkholderiaceae bacterium]MCX7902491.1 hypothetical protein [Burkholderiaceae bacterium]MDW8429565.1 hypothetical protein [Sutterellaceae bacterium]
MLLRLDEHLPEAWDPQFAAVVAQTVKLLNAHAISLIGIDMPSLDSAQSKTRDPHRRVCAHNMTILKGLSWKEVQEGNDEPLALPLERIGLGASPARAVLCAPVAPDRRGGYDVGLAASL